MPITEKNYWLTTVSIPPGDPARPLPESVDVAVVGAGFTGLSAARVLAKRGVRVGVLEAETFGWGASSRNGGMVLTGLKLPVTTLISRYGVEKVRRMYAASLASIDCVERIVREENIACDFARYGHLEVAVKQSHFDGFTKSAALIQREFNHTLRIIPKNELRGEIGSDIYFGGIVDDTSAGLKPAPYLAGLARAAQTRGPCLPYPPRRLKIHSPSAHGTRRFSLQTPPGPTSARAAVLATG